MNTQLHAYESDQPTSVGEYLALVMARLDMTQSDLAARTGLSTKHVNQIVKHNAAISPTTAAELEYATDVAAEVWAALDARHQARLARSTREQELGGATDWMTNFRLKELHSRGITTSSSATAATASELLRYFGISSPEGWSRVWQPAITSFRRSPAFTPDAAATTIWLRAGQRLAAQQRTHPYDATALRGSLDQLRALSTLDPPDALPQLQARLSDLGVALVYLAEFDGCRASGATWWATPTKAVVVLSNRGKREDRLWFSLFHELGHVLLHAKRDTFLDQNRSDDQDELPPWEEPAPASGFIDDGSRDSEIERQADEFAADTLIPAQHREALSTVTSQEDIRTIAAQVPVAPGIVAGRYQFESGRYNKFNSLRRRIPDALFNQSL